MIKKTKPEDKKHLTILNAFLKTVTKFDVEIQSYNKAVMDGSATIVAAKKAKTIETFDDGVHKYCATPEAKKDTTNFAKIGKPSEHRIKFRGVVTASTNVKNAHSKDEKYGKVAAIKQKLIEGAQNNKGALAIGLGVTALVLAVGGVCCCKYKKTCCFKEDNTMEGGERELFKKEVKSKNSHKKHAKESLVPAFEVTD